MISNGLKEVICSVIVEMFSENYNEENSEESDRSKKNIGN